MDKKSVEKKILAKELVSNKPQMKDTIKKKSANPPKESSNTQKILVENFVSLQKVMVNLSIKFDNLTTQISKLLELFEISAKALTEKDFEIEKNNKENMKILEKIENVLEQNKTIAKGLTLMHDRINEPPNYPPKMSAPRFPPQQKPPFRPIQRTSVMEGVSEKYHEPISSDGQ